MKEETRRTVKVTREELRELLNSRVPIPESAYFKPMYGDLYPDPNNGNRSFGYFSGLAISWNEPAA